MSPVGFGFMPSIVLLMILAGAVVLAAGGVAALARGRDPLLKLVGVGGIVAGGLLLLALVASRVTGVNFPGIFPFIIVFVGVIGLAVWVTALLDCAVNEPSQGNDKIVWVVIIIFAQLLGALLYLLVRRPRRIAETGR